MARELVLIPKIKYDHLLKQAQIQKTEVNSTQKSSSEDDRSLPQVEGNKKARQQKGGQTVEKKNL